MSEYITQADAVEIATRKIRAESGPEYVHELCNAAIQFWIDANKGALPEPVGSLYTIAGTQHCTITSALPDTDLFTSGQMAAAVALAKVVPDGYALVPIEPTLEMLEVGHEAFSSKDMRRHTVSGCYKAMIAAAPSTGEPIMNPNAASS